MKVSELLTDKSKWTKNAYAINDMGESVGAGGDDARAWCLLGALYKCYPDDKERGIARYKLASVIELRYGKLPTVWQDEPSTTFEMVRELILELAV